MKKTTKFKKGAASFYIVAISTLILVIIAASFAAVIISEVTRTSNDDLAQSAYDSALAGVEDAKLAYYNYQNCKNGAQYSESGLSCEILKNWVENGESPDELNTCDMVATMIGRVPDGDNGVPVQEGNDIDKNNNNMQQYYTCVTMTNKTKDVLGMLTESNPEYTVRVKFDGLRNEKIKTVKLSWHSDEDGNKNEFNFANFGGEGIFNDAKSMPAVMSLGLIQTAENFSLDQFDMTQGNTTNRGIVYLVPYDENSTIVQNGVANKYNGAWNGSENKNKIGNDGFLKSNDKTARNLPYAVYCGGEDYTCSAWVDIPDPVGGTRSDETFVFSVGLPYGGPSTHFSLEFFCGESSPCYTYTAISEESGESETITSNQAILDGVQISIDSTGKANDLYRRIETRLEPGDAAYPYPLYAIQALGGSGDGDTIQKNFYTTSEWNF